MRPDGKKRTHKNSFQIKIFKNAGVEVDVQGR